MIMESGLSGLEKAGALNLVASERGAAWIEANPDFIDISGRMCAQAAPENVLRGSSSYIGSGMYSEVRAFGGAAIKVSSPTTGKKHSGRPEHLINQYLFLTALGRRLDSLSGGEITTPEQYLAFRTANGDYVRVEEYMEDWITLSDLNRINDWAFTPKEGEVNELVKSRLKAAFREPIIRIGLNDLGLEKNEPLHSKNVMVPGVTEDVETAPLCIIDQPGTYRGYLGRLSVFLTGFSTPAELAVQTA